MTYVLHSLGAKAPNPVDVIVSTFGAAALGAAQSAVKANMTRYQAYNFFRFNDPNIKSSKDKKLKDLMKRDKDGGLIKATPVFKAFEAAAVPMAMAQFFTPKPSAKQIGKVAYANWKQIWAAALGPDDKNDKGDGDADAESTSDKTLLFVGGAAVLALIAIGAARSREKQA